MSGQVYVPSQRLRPEDVEAVLELRHTTDGELGLLAYSSLDLLVTACGPEQPWIAVPVERVAEVAGLSGADTVVWNAELPTEECRWTAT
jgi:hypothetical protein